MRKHPDPLDVRPPHAPPQVRAEKEIRIPGQRRVSAAEPLRDADAPLGMSPAPGPDGPLIGAGCVAAPLPIGPSSAPSGEAAGADMLLDEPLPLQPIVGSGDRMHHLALVPGRPAPVPPRPSPLARNDVDGLVLPLAPKSRAECRRRCGKAGFCDPSSALGCGGQFCGNASAAAREAL